MDFQKLENIYFVTFIMYYLKMSCRPISQIIQPISAEQEERQPGRAEAEHPDRPLHAAHLGEAGRDRQRAAERVSEVLEEKMSGNQE